MSGCHQATATGGPTWPRCHLSASRPRQLAAGGDAPASRGIVEPGDSGTPLSPLTETTTCQKKSSGGAWCADPQRDSAIPWAAFRARPRCWRTPRDSLVVLVQGGISALHAGWHYRASKEVSNGVGCPANGAERLPVGRVTGTISLLAVSTPIRAPQGWVSPAIRFQVRHFSRSIHNRVDRGTPGCRVINPRRSSVCII